MRSVMAVYVAAGAVLLCASPARAAPRAVQKAAPVPAKADDAPRPAPPRVQRLTFGDDVVHAGRDLGDGDVISDPPRAKHVTLVRPRVDFIPELLKSAEGL